MLLKSPATPIVSVKCFAHIWILLSNEAHLFVPEFHDEGTNWIWDINAIAGDGSSDDIHFDEIGLIFTDLKNHDIPDRVFNWEQVAHIIGESWPDEFET